MKRVSITPRRDWREKLEQTGYTWRVSENSDQSYWDESAYWEFSTAEARMLEETTNELSRLYDIALKHIVDHDLYTRFNVPDFAISAIKKSLDQRSVYGRFDLAYRGVEPPKLIEYNAETPIVLCEAAILQWQWLQECFPRDDQYNSMHEGLVEAWREIHRDTPLHLTFMESVDDREACDYLATTAEEAGWQTKLTPIDMIGISDVGEFADQDDYQIVNLFKLYPWDWVLTDPFGEKIIHAVEAGRLRVIEPAWRMLTNHKAMLALLWELFPGHPNLLEAATDRTKISGRVVGKAMLGRRGANVAIADIGADQSVYIEEQTHGVYDDNGYIYQRFTPLPRADKGGYAVIGSWVAGDKAVGIGILESDSRITGDMAKFVPHVVRD